MDFLKTILVATDFSPHSDRAVDDTIVLAKGRDSVVHLVHVVNLPIAPVLPDVGIAPTSLIGQMREYAVERIRGQAERLRAAGLKCTTHVLEGTPSRVLLEQAEELSASLIVAGKRGQSALEYVLLGSVAERVVRSAKCPVLTVHEESGPLKLDTILVASDFSQPANAALTLAHELALDADCQQLLVTHAENVELPAMQFLVQRGDHLLLEEGMPIFERISEGDVAQLQGVLETMRTSGVRLELVAAIGQPEAVILQTARARGAGLIVIGTHGRRGVSHLVLGSVAERVVRTAPCAVLSVRAATARA